MNEPNTTSSQWRAPIAFATCTLIWGSTFLAIRVGNDSVPPLWAATVRLCLASLVLFVIAGLTRRLPSKGPALRAAIWFGIFQFGLNFSLLYWGETVVASGLAAVVFATIPVTSALVARAFGIERLNPLKLGGALVALVGVGVLFAHDLMGGSTALPLLAIYLATVAAALGSVMLKRGPRQDPLGANAVGTLAGMPVCLLASVLLREHRRLPIHWNEIYPIVYLALAGSVVAFVVFAWLVIRLPVSTVAFIGVVVPVIAVTLGAIVAHERLEGRHLVGSVVVLCGVTLAALSDRWLRRTPPSPAPRG